MVVFLLLQLVMHRASAQLVISEFVADNILGLKDDDGDVEDWIEIHNPGSTAVDLAGWRLTDDPADPAKWIFPAQNLGPREYLVVFASGKDRQVPGRTWHTNFRLSAAGEYLALVRPDGTVATAFAPSYPAQVADVAYGAESATVPELWVRTGSDAHWHVPAGDTLGSAWPRSDFADAEWDRGPLGVGWDQSTNKAPVVVAHSEEDWSAGGEQGFRGWHYGYYARSRDSDGTYSAADFIAFPAGFWDGVQWRSPGGVAPWDRITRTTARPTGSNSGGERWVIRRWISSVAGELNITWHLAKQETAGSGVSARIFFKGEQRDSEILAAANTTGVTRVVRLTGVQVGDPIDLALIPAGAAGSTDDLGDDSVFGFEVSAPGAFSSWIRSDLAAAMRARNATAYVRVPFLLTPDQVAEVESLDLHVRYDDGFAAFLNGEFVVSRNAPLLTPGGVIADSLLDWASEGVQGKNGWYYGLYRRADDGDGLYDPGSEFENADPLWTWNGDGWELGPGDPPWTAITRETWHPQGNGGGAAVQWAIRRWVSQAEGTVRVALAGAKQNPGCGNGVTFRVLFNGEERFARTLGFQDTQGFATTIELENVQFGDLVDFALDPTGTDGDTADGCDGSTFAAQISQEASEALAWNSVALRSRTREEAVREAVFSLARVREHLVAGTNVLAFQVLNAAADDDELLLAPELMARRALTGGAAWRYFVAPTPGGANTGGTESPGPVVVEVAHEPAIPDDTQPLSVRALVRRTVGNVASVQLIYRVMYGAEVTVDMADDGAHGDGAVGDGWWGAVIPASASTPGQMIRWAVVARDAEGRVLRSPAYADPRRTPQYFGTVVRDPALDRSNLPVLSWFLQNAAAADGDTGTRGSLFYDGEFYDNVGANLHGQSTRGFPKKSYDLDFNPGHHFRWQRGQPRVDDLNLLTTWADKSHFRTPLAYETYAEAGAPAHFAFPVRVQLNGRFHAVANLVENGDENFLERLGLDPLGALYKMYNTADSTSGAEKKTRKFEGSQDLGALLSALAAGSAQAKESVLFDQLDVPEVVNYLAARAVTADTDCCHKNYYLYRDTRNSGEWLAFPWDVDLSFGRVWTCNSPCFSYFDETIYTNTGLFVGDNNRVFSLVLSTPSTRQMYLRRVRTLMDRLTQPPEVAPSADRWRLRSTQWRDRIAPDAALDLAKWGTWGRRETITQAVDRIHHEFLPGRRRYAFQTLVNAGTLPAAQSSNVVVRFAALETRPPSGLPSHEYLCLTNANPVAVDLSDWRLAGAVRLRFKPGTVLPARSAAYVSPDRRAFRARSTSPKGGERRLVLGNYEGELTARGGIVELWNDAGRRVAETTLPTQPSAAQQFLRVTELMYDPPPGGAEYVELLNAGSTSLSLAGVRFTAGINWAFPTLDAPSLAPGERMVLVEDLVRFRATHGTEPRVGGVFAGSLDNAGERVRLEDAAGEAILDFEFPGSGHPAADDLGFSLVVSDPLASWERWDDAEFWRVSAVLGGTPATAELAAGPGMPVVIDEVLTHTDPPLLDAVELFNSGTTSVSLEGWWLTDDPGTPQKYRFPPGTVLHAGARLVVDESQFNAPGSLTAFTFSSHGDEVWLFRADATGRLTGDADGFSFPAAANGVSFGRHTNSAGKVSFPAQSARTLGAPNSGPAFGPVVLHEIHARPARGEMPFLELRNISASEVALHDPAHPTNTWRISGVDYEFPPGFVMPPGGTLLVVGGDPLDFRIRWQLPGHIPVLGPWSGELQRDGERLELLRPDAPDLLPDGSEWVPQLVVDAVRFDVDPPWPPLRERAYGVSLERKSVTAFGDDPASWRLNEDGATPGTFATGNRAPTVSVLAVDPLEVTTFPVSVDLTGAASDDGVPSDPGRLLLRWTPISGPGVPVFTTTNAAPTRVTLPGPGLYRLRLTAFDGELSGTAEVLVEVNRPPVESVLIPSGATWRYWDQGPVAATWAQSTFDDRAWPTGPAQLGYGDGDERTVIRDTFNGSRLLTAYFRQSIQIPQPAGVRSLTLRVVRDDGALVWINGREVMRSNVPEGPLTYESTAPDTVSGVDESGFFEVAVDPAVLRAGTNVVAVEVHQQNAGSSDISFDLELRATTVSVNRAPQVEAGPDQTVVVPSISTLSATWADDGLPAVAAIRWQQVAGPAPAIWSATNQAVVQVEIRSAGVYGFEVAVDDGEWVVRDTVQVVAGDGGGSPYELWRAAHFSAAELADPRISGEGADPDGDGQSNRAEFDSGTRPRDGASVLRLRVSMADSGGARLVISIVPSRSYEVQVRSELGRGDWTRLHRLEPAGSEGEVTVSDPGPIPSGQARYYQVITPAPGP